MLINILQKYDLNRINEIAMTKKSQTKMNISSWRFHVAIKKQIYIHMKLINFVL
jgi:hypothetical protein